MIEQSRQNNTFIGVSDEDLFAPYKKKELEKHKELCQVLSKHLDIALSIDDFMHKTEHDGKAFYSMLPLQCVQVRGNNKLIVINCCYSLLEEDAASDNIDFEIAPDSVEFHLIESQDGL